MAIQYQYPRKNPPVGDDLVLISDTEDTLNPNATKSVTVQSIVDLASGGGGGAGVSSLNTLTGALTLVGGNSITAVSSGGDTVTVNLEIEQDLDLLAYNLTSSSGVRNGLVNIVSGGTGGITLNPATGYVTIDQNTWPNADGSAGQVLITDGGGLLSCSTLSTVTPGGSTTEIQFNDAGAFGGDAGLTYDKTNDILTVTGNYEGDINGAVLQKVYNNTAGTLSKGEVVYLPGGNNGDNPYADLARADSITTMPALGIVRNDITAASVGEVVTSGELTGLGSLLSGFTTGDTLYVSTSGDD